MVGIEEVRQTPKSLEEKKKKIYCYILVLIRFLFTLTLYKQTNKSKMKLHRLTARVTRVVCTGD